MLTLVEIELAENVIKLALKRLQDNQSTCMEPAGALGDDEEGAEGEGEGEEEEEAEGEAPAADADADADTDPDPGAEAEAAFFFFFFFLLAADLLLVLAVCCWSSVLTVGLTRVRVGAGSPPRSNAP